MPTPAQVDLSSPTCPRNLGLQVCTTMLAYFFWDGFSLFAWAASTVVLLITSQVIGITGMNNHACQDTLRLIDIHCVCVHTYICTHFHYTFISGLFPSFGY
jgi:hypothetical protein